MIDLDDRPHLLGERLSLEPLTDVHSAELVAAFDPATWPAIWRWYTLAIPDAAALGRFLAGIVREQAERRTVAFAIRDRASGALIGSSRYLNIDVPNLRVEIGSTWYAPEWQRTYANTEAKRLMLEHAFDRWGCLCVQLQTDELNERSRRAIERLGARLDGVLRGHRLCDDGRVRHSAVYSVLREEWPAVRQRLTSRCASPARTAG